MVVAEIDLAIETLEAFRTFIVDASKDHILGTHEMTVWVARELIYLKDLRKRNYVDNLKAPGPLGWKDPYISELAKRAYQYADSPRRQALLEAIDILVNL